MLPLESVAVALIVCVPLLKSVVFQLAEYGEVTSSADVPLSTWIETFDTAMLSVAVARMVTAEPETVLPFVGVVIVTVGGVVSTTGGVGVEVGVGDETGVGEGVGVGAKDGLSP